LVVKGKRLKKRQLKQDRFVTTAFEAAGYFQHHRNRIFLAAAGSLFLLAVLFLFVRFQVGSSRTAELLLGQGVGMYSTGNYKEAVFRLSTFLDGHAKHQDAGYAALLCGDASLYQGLAEDASRYYRLVLEKEEEGSEYWFAARAGLATLEEAMGRSIEAAKIYESLAGMRDDPLAKAHLLLSAARAYENGGEHAKASELLDLLDSSALDPIDLASLGMAKAAVALALDEKEAPPAAP